MTAVYRVIVFLICPFLVIDLVSCVDFMRVARCRSQCISKVSRGSKMLTDSVCRSSAECQICWENCYNLLHDWDLWGRLCAPADFCKTSEGCMASCEAVQKQEPTSEMVRQVLFGKVQLHFIPSTRLLSFKWSRPEVPQNTVLVYWLFYRDVSADGTWSSLTQTLNHTLEFAVTAAPQQHSFRLVAVSPRGEVAQSAVVRLDDQGQPEVVDKPQTYPTAGPSGGHVDEDWELMVRGMRVLMKALTNESVLSPLREKLLLQTSVTQSPPPASSTPIILAVALSVAGVVLLVLLFMLFWLTRSQRRHLRELRSALGGWSSRVGTSMRSSIHRAQSSFRRSVFSSKPSDKGVGSRRTGDSARSAASAADSGVADTTGSTAPCLPPRQPSHCTKNYPPEQQSSVLQIQKHQEPSGVNSYEYITVDTSPEPDIIV